jgi:DNA-directed RNA polymerase subunit RPC12/RpoP
MTKAITVKYVCDNCKSSFVAPVLSDFSYGDFLLWSASDSVVFMGAIGDRAYKEVMDWIEVKEQSGAMKGLDTAHILQTLFGELACDVDSAGRPYHIGRPPCPNCGSRRMYSVGDKIVGWVDISDVSHNEWFSLSAQEKEDRLDRALSELLARMSNNQEHNY